MKKLFISVTSLILTFTLLFCGAILSGNPYTVTGAQTLSGTAPRGALVLDAQTELTMRSDMAYEPDKNNPIDLTGYNLVFCDDFNGEAVDVSAWDLIGGDGVPSRAGIRTSKYTYVENGKLHLPMKLVDFEWNGETHKAYTLTDMELRQTFTYGYYECRAIMPKCHNGSGAFWIQSPDAYTDGVAPEGGVEIDINESQCYAGSHIGSYQNDPQVYEVNIHYNSDANRKKLRAHGIKVPGDDMYENFHTYGLLWTPDWYVFYVDGYPAYKTQFGVAGPKAVEHVRLSTDLRGDNFQLASTSWVQDGETEMVVDYVKVWQLDDPGDYPDFESSKVLSYFNDIITRIYAFFDKVADFFRSLFKIN